MQESLSPAGQEISHVHFITNLMVWGMEPIVTHQTSWLESTGVCGAQQNLSVCYSGLACGPAWLRTSVPAHAYQCSSLSQHAAQVCVVLLS